MMKTKSIRNLIALGAVIALLPAASTVRADAALNPQPETKEQTASAKPAADIQEYTGTISAVDAEERMVKVDKYFWDKSFNLAENCTYSVGMDREAVLDNLRPDMEVVVTYQDRDGVLVATHIAQRQYHQTGYIKSATPVTHEIVLDRVAMAKKFKVNDNTQFTIHKNEAKLDDLKPGQKVTITYTHEGDQYIVQQVVDTSETFSGSVLAIDVATNTLKVKSLLTTHKFNLADGCKIVLNGNTTGKLRDLRIGQKVSINYEEVKGIMVAARIELAPADGSGSTVAQVPVQ